MFGERISSYILNIAIHKVIRQLLNFNLEGTRIKIYWMPSRAGIAGNEAAEKLTGEGRSKTKKST